MATNNILNQFKWYHGDSNERENFQNQIYDRDRTTNYQNEYGPGIYFTNDLETANRYGNFLYECLPDVNFRLLPNKKPSMKLLLDLYKQANEDQKETFLSNWGERISPQTALKNYLDNSNFDTFILLYHDLFLYEADSFISAVQKLNFDGFIEKVNDDTYYLIVWNPNKCKITRIEKENDIEKVNKVKRIKASIKALDNGNIAQALKILKRTL